ncbi:type 2 periplasmic-binding domain-containing protein [Algoriphagus pacificus]|uniref:Transglutaminase-like superfamily protein n=1 Tax=Algoriphagus pacificus TaxID=2811234 RepID=A0ABS3CDB5_9BACT|nr:hypothetical protein [Algoriphagus pacificus]MBN7814171.1 hypothetical protein [Algoriphagus pacificus]
MILTYLTLLGLSSFVFAQEKVYQEENLFFETDTEKQIWDSDQKDPLKLFTAVKADEVRPEKWEALVQELDEKRLKTKKDLNFLRVLFQKSHQNLLKSYVQHSTFNEMLKEGKFDCVSGSATLGMLLDRYKFDYDIVETDYHVFILVRLDGKNIILESTLPIGGMITSPSEVQAYLDSYAPVEFAQLGSLTQRLGNSTIDFSDHAIFRKVSLVELAGLQYYNDAITHFNSQKFGLASKQLSKALLLYDSERIKNLRELAIEQAYKVYGYDVK